MSYKVKNNVFLDGRQYTAGEEISEKEAEAMGMDNCEEFEGKKKDEQEENEDDQEDDQE
ncbi:MAG TPA: hypothetical protein VI727_01245 [Candidatus Brocadiaceae bacterium]|nr:hypothetical protein [Candidatus Brocadiaceae bacterium]